MDDGRAMPADGLLVFSGTVSLVSGQSILGIGLTELDHQLVPEVLATIDAAAMEKLRPSPLLKLFWGMESPGMGVHQQVVRTKGKAFHSPPHARRPA